VPEKLVNEEGGRVARYDAIAKGLKEEVTWISLSPAPANSSSLSTE